MLDVVFVAMFLLVPILVVSIWLVRHGHYKLHKRLQVALATVLLVAVATFEVDIRFFTNWRQLAMPSPYYREDGWSAVWIALAVHLCFAIPAAVLWSIVTVRALRNFSQPPLPGVHSHFHRRWGWLAAGSIVMTALTGWIFYYLAFVATGQEAIGQA